MHINISRVAFNKQMLQTNYIQCNIRGDNSNQKQKKQLRIRQIKDSTESFK